MDYVLIVIHRPSTFLFLIAHTVLRQRTWHLRCFWGFAANWAFNFVTRCHQDSLNDIDQTMSALRWIGASVSLRCTLTSWKLPDHKLLHLQSKAILSFTCLSLLSEVSSYMALFQNKRLQLLPRCFWAKDTLFIVHEKPYQYVSPTINQNPELAQYSTEGGKLELP